MKREVLCLHGGFVFIFFVIFPIRNPSAFFLPQPLG